MNEKNKNLPDPEDPEEFNKQLLKQAAVTFTREGISNDLKYFIQKKIIHNRTNITYVTQLMDLTINSDSKETKELAFKRGSPLKGLLEHVYSEIIKTDILMNKAINFVLKKDPSIKGLEE